MNIGIFSSSAGGHFRFTVDLAKFLTKLDNDIEITLFFVGSKNLQKVFYKNDEMTKIHFYYFLYNDLKSMTSSINFLKVCKNLDILHINSALFGPLAIFLKTLNSAKIIYTLHGIADTDPNSKKVSIIVNRNTVYRKILYGLDKKLVPFIAKKADAVTTVSNYSKKSIEQVYGFSPIVVYNGVDPNVFGRYISPTQAKHELGINEKTKVILNIATLLPIKDPFTLIKSIPEVAKYNPNVKYVVIGDGPLYSEIIKLSTSLSCQKNVVFLKNISQNSLLLYLNAADVYVSPSLAECFGLANVEAMACKVPVVAARAYAVPEILGDVGLLFEPCDAEGLAKNVIKILDKPELAKELGEKGYNRVVNNFTVERFAKEYYEVYKKVVAGK